MKRHPSGIAAPSGTDRKLGTPRRRQVLDAQQTAVVGPDLADFEAGPAGEVAEAAEGVLVRALGPDALALAETEPGRPDVGGLVGEADEVHFDPPLPRLVEGVVAEAVEAEVAAQLAVNAGQQVQVEVAGDAGRVVVGGVQQVRVFLQVHADQDAAAGAAARPPVRSAGPSA